MSEHGNGHEVDAHLDAEIEQAARAESPAEVRTALVRTLERVRVIVGNQLRFVARYERDQGTMSERHGELLGEIARLCDLVAGALRVEDRVEALERARRASTKRKLATLEDQAQRQRQAVEQAPHDPESTGMHRLVSTERAIDELRRELVTHTAKEDARVAESERRRSLSEADQVEQRKARRDDTRAALRWVGGVVGAVVLLVGSWLLGRLTGHPVDLRPLP